METEKAISAAGGALAELLFEPFLLIQELYGALFPGLMFTLLLVLKGHLPQTGMLASAALGYKTRLVLFVFVSYIVGKVLTLTLVGVGVFLMKIGSALASEPPTSGEGGDAIWFLVGGVALAVLGSKRHGLSSAAMERAGATFSIAAGWGLVVASAIPRDGYLRWWELGTGVLLLVAAAPLRKQADRALFALFGSAAADRADSGKLAVAELMAAVARAAKAWPGLITPAPSSLGSGAPAAAPQSEATAGRASTLLGKAAGSAAEPEGQTLSSKGVATRPDSR